MTDTDSHTYRIDTFSPGHQTVAGPADLGEEEEALAYLAQRMADQHCGALSSAYWRNQARVALAEARDKLDVAGIRRVARGRGVLVTAAASVTSAAFRVRVFPLYEDDGKAGELCAAFDHPRLAVAMKEAGSAPKPGCVSVLLRSRRSRNVASWSASRPR